MILQELYLKEQTQLITDVDLLLKVQVDHFGGIEIEEFPAQIAQVALWLVDHQMNMQASALFGRYYARLPCVKRKHLMKSVTASNPIRGYLAHAVRPLLLWVY